VTNERVEKKMSLEHPILKQVLENGGCFALSLGSGKVFLSTQWEPLGGGEPSGSELTVPDVLQTLVEYGLPLVSCQFSVEVRCGGRRRLLSVVVEGVVPAEVAPQGGGSTTVESAGPQGGRGEVTPSSKDSTTPRSLNADFSGEHTTPPPLSTHGKLIKSGYVGSI